MYSSVKPTGQRYGGAEGSGPLALLLLLLLLLLAVGLAEDADERVVATLDVTLLREVTDATLVVLAWWKSDT